MTSICLRPARRAKHVRVAPCLATRIISDQPSLRLAGIPEKTAKFTPPAHFGAGAERVASVPPAPKITERYSSRALAGSEASASAADAHVAASSEAPMMPGTIVVRSNDVSIAEDLAV